MHNEEHVYAIICICMPCAIQNGFKRDSNSKRNEIVSFCCFWQIWLKSDFSSIKYNVFFQLQFVIVNQVCSKYEQS